TLLVSVTGCTEVTDRIQSLFDKEETTTDNSDLRVKELELRERELALKEEELKNGNGEASPVVGTFQPNARVTGSAVQLREDHSTTAQSIKSMKKNDLLVVLEEFTPQDNYGEAILIQKTDFFDEYYGSFSFSLPKGKAVMVEGQVEGNRCRISYMDIKTKKKGFAKIDRNLLEFISGKPWYKVRREDGMTGWVYSEFVERL
ncbi:MAG: SH3 domain-containing protein, partial [Flavobacteriales bacterium]